MTPFQRLSTTRSRMFRRSEGPQTPEPQTQGAPEQPPSPPRQRFRLKLRNAPQTNSVPTQQFLESVAAADVPIPSIEGPTLFNDDMADENFGPASEASEAMDMSINGFAGGRLFSPPKTPAPTESPHTTLYNQFPDWSYGSHDSSFSGVESSPECESSRPSTARSTLTNASIFSRYSFTSDDLSECSSPLAEQKSIFGDYLSADDANKTIRAPIASKKLRKAPWTQVMDAHIWYTYMLYMQDPTVTPMRMGKSGIPPDGVLHRVAREARRSWKGASAVARSVNQSGSMTPTLEEAPRPFIQWPHTDAATRAQLRELCKANASTTTRTSRYMATSPTPSGGHGGHYGHPPLTPCSMFSSSDMAMSLTLSTSDSMQEEGPLAQLASSEAQLPISDELPTLPVEQQAPVTPVQAPVTPVAAPQSALPKWAPATFPRLGSPFVARSYGPSSSSSLAEALGLDSGPQRQNHTVGPRRSLRSPARVERSRSNTLKRPPRPTQLELRRSKRPSLASDMWNEPTASPVQPPSELSSIASSHGGDIFVSSNNNQQLFEAMRPSAASTTMTDAPARLGSPFTMPTSFSFPSRLFRSRGLDSGSPSQSSTSNTAASSTETTHGNNAGASGSSRSSRMTYLNQRLRDFRPRDDQRQRSRSPL